MKNLCTRLRLYRLILLLGLLWSLECNAQDTINKINLSYIMAIESAGNPLAVNKADTTIDWDDSYGLYQITPPCLAVYNKRCHHNYQIKDLFNPKVNWRIAYWMFYYEIPRLFRVYGIENTINNKLIAYNAGILFLIRKRKLPVITQDYIKKYHKLESASKKNGSI